MSNEYGISACPFFVKRSLCKRWRFFYCLIFCIEEAPNCIWLGAYVVLSLLDDYFLDTVAKFSNIHPSGESYGCFTVDSLLEYGLPHHV